MSTPPTVCVALSVKDGGAYLPEAIESVLAQEDVPLELRIYDNGSTDASFEVYERYVADPRVLLASNPAGMNFYDSMNRALSETTARWLVPWCADDVMLPRNIATKLAAAERTGARLAFAPVVSVDGDGNAGKTLCDDLGRLPQVFEAPELLPHIVPSNTVPIPGLLASTPALREVGGFEPRLYLCGDWMMWLRLSLRIRSVYVPEPGILYREHSANATSIARRAGAFATELVATLRAAYRDPAFPADQQWTLRDHLITILSDQAFSHLASGLVRVPSCVRPAYALAFDALRLDPARDSLVAQFQHMVRAAELPLTRLPASVVAAPEPTVDDVTASLQALRRLVAAPRLVGRVQVAARGEDADALIALIEDDLARNGDVDLELSVTPDPLSLVGPGDVFLAQLDDERAAAVEQQCGATVCWSRTPDPLADDSALRGSAAHA